MIWRISRHSDLNLKIICGASAGSASGRSADAESVETTQAYVHADMRLKERALARVAPTNAGSARYKPDDALLAFLESL